LSPGSVFSRQGFALQRPATDLVAWRFLRTATRTLAARRLDLTVEGQEHVPTSGPVLIAARHYHHLYDGVALVSTLDRPVHIVVGLDWVQSPLGQRVMNLACGAARWPVVHRPDALDRVDVAERVASAREMTRLLRRATNDTADLLRAGRAVIVFPEGYPNIDPGFTPKRGDEFLPFQPGAIRLARVAQASGAGVVPILPAGFQYNQTAPGRWRVVLRFGPPLLLADRVHDGEARQKLERAVTRLSA